MGAGALGLALGAGRWARGGVAGVGLAWARGRALQAARLGAGCWTRGRVVGSQGGRCAGGWHAGARGMRGKVRKTRGKGAVGRAELVGHRCCARGHARPRRGLGAGWVCWLGQLG